MENKYAFLLALQVGESFSFDITPTPSESRRKVPASVRKAYYRVQTGVKSVTLAHPSFIYMVRVDKQNDKKLIVTLIKAGEKTVNPDDIRSFEQRSQSQKEAWRKRRVKEEAPLLNGQLAEAAVNEVVTRTTKAIIAVQNKNTAPQYDPAKIARLVAAHCNGEAIEHKTDAGDWIADHKPTWLLSTDRYRIKPRIREWFLVIALDGKVTVGAETIEALPHHNPERRVHVREVLPEEEI